MIVRYKLEEREERSLSPFATLSTESKGTLFSVEKPNDCTIFMRDKYSIQNAAAFKGLSEKAHASQVSLTTDKGRRSRLDYSLKCAELSRELAEKLTLNEDLAEAISLGLELGQPPFGRIGERVLREMFYDGFDHGSQSLRVVDHLENSSGINLSYEVRNGILKHSGNWPFNQQSKNLSSYPFTLEGQLAGFVDKFLLLNYLIEDGVACGYIKASQLPVEITAVLGDNFTHRIDHFAGSITKSSQNSSTIKLDPATAAAFYALYEFIYVKLFLNTQYVIGEQQIINRFHNVYQFFYDHPEELVYYTDQCSDEELEFELERKIIDVLASLSEVKLLEIANNVKRA
ncbi:MAG TPA: hypothetical protein VKS21_09830 [Spirochaetota bacterium]|nr:hypothetical protein [Spirochaetota bacterium]